MYQQLVQIFVPDSDSLVYLPFVLAAGFLCLL